MTFWTLLEAKIFSPAARVYVAYHNDIKSERELELVAIVNLILRMILRASTICKFNYNYHFINSPICTVPLYHS